MSYSTFIPDVHPMCILVVGDVGDLGPQVIHGPYPGAAEETGHADQTAVH